MIVEYHNKYFGWLSQAVESREILFQFSGDTWNFPLVSSQIDAYIISNPNKKLYIGLRNELPYAFGEIIFDDDKPCPRLGRILIGHAQNRNKGLGQVFVNGLLELCNTQKSKKQVYLYVLANNEIAIACYLRCGFKFESEIITFLGSNSEPYRALLMRHDCNI